MLHSCHDQLIVWNSVGGLNFSRKTELNFIEKFRFSENTNIFFEKLFVWPLLLYFLCNFTFYIPLVIG